MNLAEYEAEQARLERRRIDAARATIALFVERFEQGAYTPFPEPPRDSGEADAVNGPTALRTHQDNTRGRSSVGHDARS